MEPVRTLWLGHSIPLAQHACMASFVRVGHVMEVFTYDAHPDLPPGVLRRDAREILPESRVFAYGSAAGINAGSLAAFSNLFRYEMLRRIGGYWVDADVFCLRAFPGAPVIIAGERTKSGETSPTSCVLKCPPGHDFAVLCSREAQRHAPETLRFGQIGPQLVARVVQELALEAAVAEPQVFCPVDWFEFERLNQVAPFSRQTCAVHLWNEMWRLRGRPVPWPGSPGSVLETLARAATSGTLVPAS